ncbi:YicC/YloC family endoribonuclease [Acidaminococcus provencensis]|uniref:YicC/YloC family endoribonuclease n=1 Tax=Acidaminococcus provencensis TaxID=2058289 RepID=UPI0022E52D92|nr:YicC/YloC family endoribonuclease [Acidaminococcus provencensis]
MVQSMTGYGRGEVQKDDFSFTIEIKTVNHRYAELAMRLPRFLNPVENRIRKQILDQLLRGRIDVFITASYTGTEGRRVKIDKGLVKAYYDSLKDMAQMLSIPAENLGNQQEILFIAGCDQVMVPEDTEVDLETLWPLMENAVQQAIQRCLAMRQLEGDHISQDVANRIALIGQQLAQVEARAPQTVAEYERRLREKIQALLDEAGAGKLDPAGILQETAVYADRVNVTEEIVRLHSHLQQFTQMLHEEKPVGRRMDFLVQEMNREANTIASKAGDAQIIQVIVDMKGEIEKVREQIQNIQ